MEGKTTLREGWICFIGENVSTICSPVRVSRIFPYSSLGRCVWYSQFLFYPFESNQLFCILNNASHELSYRCSLTHLFGRDIVEPRFILISKFAHQIGYFIFECSNQWRLSRQVSANKEISSDYWVVVYRTSIPFKTFRPSTISSARSKSHATFPSWRLDCNLLVNFFGMDWWKPLYAADNCEITWLCWSTIQMARTY